MKKILIIIVGAILFYGCKNSQVTTLPYFNTADFTPIWLKKTDPGLKSLHTIPPFSFTDQNGKLISEKTTAGKIYVVNFFFTRCNNICPKMTDNMKAAADAFMNDNNVLFISHTVTPWLDDVAVLKKYAETKNITNPNWHLVTGSKEEIYTIARRGYFADAATSAAITSQFLHTENFILVDKQRHIRGVYNGTIEIEVQNLINQIKLLKQEN